MKGNDRLNKNESKYFNTAVKMNMALIEILKTKPFEFITVSEICKKAGVNRSTFYLHYENTKDLLELIEKLTAKNVEFISKKEAIDTTTPTGKFMLTVFGAVAELEREYILQRQREGIAIAKENGIYKGRKHFTCKEIYTGAVC